MASFGLPLVVEYSVTTDACLKQGELNGRSLVGWKSRYFMEVAYWLLGFALAIICAAMAQMGFAVAIFLVGLFFFLRSIIRNYLSFKPQEAIAAQGFHQDEVRMEICDEGFTEHDNGIESFAPWRAMKNGCIYKEVLFIELANGLWAIIPAATLKPDNVTIQEIYELLMENGVKDRFAKTV